MIAPLLLIGLALAAPPGPRGCAHAWNDGAPTALQARVVALHPRRAAVGGAVVGTVEWTKTTRTSTSDEACAIEFRAGTSALAVSGVWRDGHVAVWRRAPRSTVLAMARQRSNATVARDGSIHFR